MSQVPASGPVPTDWLDDVEGYEPAQFSLRRAEMAVIARMLARLTPCRLLEIASTRFLFRCNAGGLNVCLEDDETHFDAVCKSIPGGLGIVLRYVNVPSSQLMHAPLNKPSSPRITAVLRRLVGRPYVVKQDLRLIKKYVLVPQWLWQCRFDLAIVDGPVAYHGNSPGRSGSLNLALRLVAEEGVVLIHDCHRSHESRLIAEAATTRVALFIPGTELAALI